VNNADDQDYGLKPTPELYDALQEAYEFLNVALFDGSLLNCVITLQRRNRAYGYFSPMRFERRNGPSRDEIALNPSYFPTRSLADTLATLAHEMVHLWQSHYGKPGRRGYHNREWADKMRVIGLQPSSNGAVGGRETGDTMSHYILPDGQFITAIETLKRQGFRLEWSESIHYRSAAAEPDSGESAGESENKSGKRVKYTCPGCGLNAWARHNAQIKCMADDAQLLPEASVTEPPSR
tara:strand:+ start:8345 stop:9055 length:711 start_codon:yes stop_codon:yes gene_type:complete